MKKFVLVILPTALLTAALLAGCGQPGGAGGAAPSASDGAAPSASDSAAPAPPSAGASASAAAGSDMSQPFGLNQTATFSQTAYTMKVTATDVKTSAGNDNDKPQDGNIFVGVNFSIENDMSNDYTMDENQMINAYVNGTAVSRLGFERGIFPDDQYKDTIPAGQSMSDYYVVEVPSGTAEVDITVNPDFLGLETATFKIPVPSN